MINTVLIIGYILCWIITYYSIDYYNTKNDVYVDEAGKITLVAFCFVGPLFLICILFYYIVIHFTKFLDYIGNKVKLSLNKRLRQEQELELCRKILREHGINPEGE